MKVVHRGFDTIALAIEANISHTLYDLMIEAQERAAADQRDADFIHNGVTLLIKGYGGNGYKIIASGGHMGATWFIKKPNPKDRWGIRVSVGSAFLATQGLGAARAHINETLASLGVEFGPNQVSISRADFCIDFLAPDFELVPENFVMHSHCNRSDHIAAEDMRINGKSGRVTSVTIGGSKRRQVIVYDKRAEVIQRHKPLWWEIWNHNLKADNLLPLDPSDASKSRVWRVELRAGKDLLKGVWNIRRWAEFDAKLGDLMIDTLGKIRYTVPDKNDTNRARWPNAEIWDATMKEVENDLVEMRSFVEPDKVKFVYQFEQDRILQAQIVGLVISRGALYSQSIDKMPEFAKKVGREVAIAVFADPEHFERKLFAAEKKYVFISDIS